MLQAYTGLPKHYSTKFGQLAVKKYSGEYEEGSLEKLIKEAIEHLKSWKADPYSENLSAFVSALKAVASARDAAYEVRQEMLPQALALVEEYK